MKMPCKLLPCIVLVLLCGFIRTCRSQDGDDTPGPPEKPSPEMESCDGVFLSYTFKGREKAYPFVKNVSAQAWSFTSVATVLNTGAHEVKSWKMYVGFQHRELLVSMDGAVAVEADGIPVRAGNNGTVLAGYPQSDLKTAIDTAGDYSQIQVQVNLKGTMFGVPEKGTPMPRAIRLTNEGYKCPVPKIRGGYMYVCCARDPKYKEENITTKFMPRQKGDLSLTYDVIKAFDNKYLAQVTMENNHPLSRLDQWNITWEWMRNEFVSNIQGAYTHKRDSTECVYGPPGQYYNDLDFSSIINCQKKPVFSDLPPEKENDEKVGKIPYCCKNGTLLPKTMNETRARAAFQLEVYKLPPDLNRTSITPPLNWKIEGRLSPYYKCSQPIRVDPSEFPDPTGIPAKLSAVASWQVTCNITSPKPKQAKCCVSYSAYYSEIAVPCNTCSCGCSENARCDTNASPLPIPPNALLVPFVNRTEQQKAFANLKRKKLPTKWPCADHCGVSINWHIDSDYKTGFTTKVTLFNWENEVFPDWFSAFEMKKALPGFEKSYSFNGTKLDKVVFMQGLPGSNYLVAETNGSNPDKDPRVPGKQQSVIQFSKKHLPKMDVPHGDGFPSKFYFNGAECALPKEFPRGINGAERYHVSVIFAISLVVLTFLFLTDSL